VVAAQLRISERTVRFHLSECKRRLGATTRAQAIVIAIGLGEIRTSVKSAVRPKD
jgi:DNA-binding CsgD family transcriptional regulator